MRKRIIFYNLLPFLLYSCASVTYDKKGNYFNGDTYHWVRVEILNDSEIRIKENNGGVLSSCNGNFETISKNEIRVNCRDSRGDSINKGSIVNIIPSEFNVHGEVIRFKKDKIIYKGTVLNKVP